jgi:hypothetical protein
MDQTLQNNGLPKMSDVYSNIQTPGLNDIGGSLGDKATSVNQGPSNAFHSYADFAKTLQNPYDTYQNLLTQNGIPQLQKTSESLQGNVNNLENSINRVTPNVSANTSNSLVTDSQRQGMIANQELPLEQQLAPLSNALGQVNTSLSTQEQNIGNEVNALNTGNSQQLQVGALGVSVSQDNAARSMTGFTQDADNQLQGLLQKMTITGNLDAAEWQTLSTLATQKQAYQQALGTISAQNKADIAKSQAGIVTLGPAQTAYNTVNGAHYTAGY